jgi:hypothetical protein
LRWFEVSTHAFRYFKNFYSSHGSSKPLVAIPNDAIVKIKPFKDFNKDVYFKGKTRHKDLALEMRLFDHMFEVELFHDYESLYLYRELDPNQLHLSGKDL